jgi:hypothetical protein
VNDGQPPCVNFGQSTSRVITILFDIGRRFRHENHVPLLEQTGFHTPPQELTALAPSKLAQTMRAALQNSNSSMTISRLNTRDLCQRSSSFRTLQSDFLVPLGDSACNQEAGCHDSRGKVGRKLSQRTCGIECFPSRLQPRDNWT